MASPSSQQLGHHLSHTQTHILLLTTTCCVCVQYKLQLLQDGMSGEKERVRDRHRVRGLHFHGVVCGNDWQKELGLNFVCKSGSNETEKVGLINNKLCVVPVATLAAHTIKPHLTESLTYNSLLTSKA